MSNERIRLLLAELTQLVPSGANEAKVALVHDESDHLDLPFCATHEGFLRFGLAFMNAAFADATRTGFAGGDVVTLQLDTLMSSDSNVEFHCERVQVVLDAPERAPHTPGLVGGALANAIVWFLLLSLAVGLLFGVYKVIEFIGSWF